MTAIPSNYRRHLKIVGMALDRDGIALSQHIVASTAMTLAGTLASGGTYTAADGTNIKVGHLIGVYSSANLASVVFTIVGTDPDGLTLSETVTGVNNSTVFSTKYFYTVTSVTPDTTDGVNNVEVGIGNTFASQRVPIESRTPSFECGLGVAASGTYSVSAQLTMDDIYDSSVTPSYIADTTFATKTSTFYSKLGVFVTAVRFIAISYSSTPSFVFHVLQNGNG